MCAQNRKAVEDKAGKRCFSYTHKSESALENPNEKLIDLESLVSITVKNLGIIFFLVSNPQESFMTTVNS